MPEKFRVAPRAFTQLCDGEKTECRQRDGSNFLPLAGSANRAMAPMISRNAGGMLLRSSIVVVLPGLEKNAQSFCK